jgi:hypothetical protein
MLGSPLQLSNTQTEKINKYIKLNFPAGSKATKGRTSKKPDRQPQPPESDSGEETQGIEGDEFEDEVDIGGGAGGGAAAQQGDWLTDHRNLEEALAGRSQGLQPVLSPKPPRPKKKHKTASPLSSSSSSSSSSVRSVSTTPPPRGPRPDSSPPEQRRMQSSSSVLSGNRMQREVLQPFENEDGA